jgi:hypothetical protein
MLHFLFPNLLSRNKLCAIADEASRATLNEWTKRISFGPLAQSPSGGLCVVVL